MVRHEPPTFGPRPSHPDDELLVAYLTAGLSRDEEATVDTHLESCDACLATLQLMHQRLAVAAEVPVTVPHSIRQRTAVPSPDGQWLSAIVARLGALFPLPALVPAAVALAAVLAVGVHTWTQRGPSPEHTRAIPWRQSLRVTVPEAAVRRQPTTHGEVIGTLRRGTVVEIRGEERDWYRVALSDASEGWVERDAFE